MCGHCCRRRAGPRHSDDADTDTDADTGKWTSNCISYANLTLVTMMDRFAPHQYFTQCKWALISLSDAGDRHDTNADTNIDVDVAKRILSVCTVTR